MIRTVFQSLRITYAVSYVALTKDKKNPGNHADLKIQKSKK